MTRQKNNIYYTKIDMVNGSDSHLFICQKDNSGKYFVTKGAKSLCERGKRIVVPKLYTTSEVFSLEVKRGIFYREDYHKMFVMHFLGGCVEVMPKEVCYKCLLTVVSI